MQPFIVGHWLNQSGLTSCLIEFKQTATPMITLKGVLHDLLSLGRFLNF